MPDVKCHNCGQYYDIQPHEYQGLCDDCNPTLKYSYEKCKELIAKPPGYKLEIGGKTWVRMHDSPDKHLEDYYFDIETGDYRHASRLFTE